VKDKEYAAPRLLEGTPEQVRRIRRIQRTRQWELWSVLDKTFFFEGLLEAYYCLHNPLFTFIIWLEARLQPNIGNTLGRVLMVFMHSGITLMKSEPIWMKSGALSVRCPRLALADFGRDPCSSESGRAR